ncbi:MAG: hypothetical protein KDA57_19010 [Planctomycetales bacterium]|nr:hypothetical protein [Planctomycetales bacterium]
MWQAAATAPVAAADLGGGPADRIVEDAPPPARGWSLDFSVNGWLPWMKGDAVVPGAVQDVAVNLDVAPTDVLGSLDWSKLPVWMSYVELRNGRFAVFNDIVYAALSDSAGFEGRFLKGRINADVELAIVELGASYAIWQSGGAGASATSAIDILAGGRYWYQSLALDLAVGNINVARSGSIDWVDPFIGLQLRQTVAPGQSLLVRGDIGGFGAGSDFTWQAIAKYNLELRRIGSTTIDAFIGYRALSADYTEGGFQYDAIMHGPMMGITSKF